jgi:hypothetical protein
MGRQHRVRPGRRREDILYKVHVWRSIAVLITDDPPFPDPGARRLLAASLMHIFGQAESPLFPARTPDEFIACVKELHEAKMLGVEDGVAFVAFPDRDALGRTYARRVPRHEMGEFIEALRQSIAEDPSGDQ